MPAGAAFPHLLSSISLGRVSLRNRVQVTAHATANIDRHGLPDDRDVAYFAQRARGGAALLTMGTHAVHPSSSTDHSAYAGFHPRIAGRWSAIADAVHEHGARVTVQLGHMGQREGTHPGALWSPSDIAFHVVNRTPHAMSAGECEALVAAFADAAERAVAAGMDGVELAFGHGQLINQFLSPLTNVRTDAYGGSPDARLLLARQVLTAVREAVGAETLLGLRINFSDGVPGGLDEDDWVAIARALTESGEATHLNVSTNFQYSLIPSLFHPQGLWLETAQRIRAAVSVPVLAAGRIVDPQVAERALASGCADMVGMTRALIADPELVNKVRDGAADRIRPCVGCVQMCLGELERGRNVKCLYNPVTGHEGTRAGLERGRASRPQRVVVVGGGPAGLETARVAARRGHEVVLLERRERLGGLVPQIARPGPRGELASAVGWLGAEVRRLGVDVRLGVDATPELLRDLAADTVILATGGRSSRPVWAQGCARVIGHREVLDDEPVLAVVRSCVVVDDDDFGQGLVTAALLAEKVGDVRLVATGASVAPRLERGMREELIGLARARGVALHAAAARPTVTTDCDQARLEVVLGDGEEPAAFLADCIVTTWTAPERSLAEAWPEGQIVRFVGDALSPRRIEHAVEDGFLAAAAL